MKHLLFVLPILLSFNACVSGHIDVEEACTQQHFLTVPANLPIPGGELSVTTTHDFSEPVSKLAKFGKVSINIHEITLKTDENVDLSFIDNLSVGFVKDDGTIEILARASSVGDVDTINFEVGNQSAELQEQIQSRPFKLVVSGQASSSPVSFTPSLKVCASLRADVDSTK